ncbi:MAG: LPXTG cell wall anchor domain-containing protein [Solirubrobacterales bacterium]
MNRLGSLPTPGSFIRGHLLIAALLAAALAFVVAPERAAAHAGEVHTEPTPSKTAPPGPSQKEAVGGPSGRSNGSGSSAGVASEPEGTREVADVPPPPVEPDTDPTLHFAALGALLLGGAGFLLVRRRRRRLLV